MVDESPSDQGLVHLRGEILLYVAPDGQVTLDVRLEADSVWLSQAQMAQLFGRERSVITRHVGNVFRAARSGPNLIQAGPPIDAPSR
jgi:hypothetical protein